MEFNGHHNDKSIKVCLDTRSKNNYVNAALAKKLNVKPIGNIFHVKTANGQKPEINKRADISFTLVQIPHLTVKTSVFVLKDLPIESNLGLVFTEQFSVELNFAEKKMKIEGIEIEIPTLRKEPLPFQIDC